MIGDHLAISDFTWAPRPSEVRRFFSGMTLPSSRRRFCTVSSSRAVSRAAESLATIAGSVPAGAKIAFQACTCQSGRPASAEVGTSGRAGERSGMPIA